jgi:hypothetical protein
LWNVIMKSTGIAWLLVVALAVGVQGPVQARPASHFGTPSSMRSGFSSQKSLPAPSAPPSAARGSGPGSFGKAAPQADPRSSSASSRDMEQNAAQANALKTLDARNAAAASAAAGAGAVPPAPPLNGNFGRPQQSAPMPVYNQPAYPQQLPQPVIVQQHGNSGLMAGVVGFMLGRATSHPAPVYYPPVVVQNTPAAGSPGATGGTVSADGSTAPAAAAAMTPVPVPAPQPSFAASVLRVFFWLALMSGLVWLVVYMVWKVRRIRAANAAHYSFERN